MKISKLLANKKTLLKKSMKNVLQNMQNCTMGGPTREREPREVKKTRRGIRGNANVHA